MPRGAVDRPGTFTRGACPRTSINDNGPGMNIVMVYVIGRGTCAESIMATLVADASELSKSHL
jgi:hypothetical protein